MLLMVFQFTPLLLPPLLAAIIGAGMVAVMWRKRPKTAATEFAVELSGHTLWALGMGMVLASVPLPLKFFWFSVGLYGAALAASAWPVFALAYTGYGHVVTRWRAALLWAPLVVGFPVSVLNVGELTFVDPAVVNGRFVYEWGPIAWGILWYSTVTALTGIVIFGRFTLHSQNYYRKIAFWSVITSSTSLIAPWLGFLRETPLPHLLLWPYIFVVVGTLTTLFVLRARYATYLPIDRLYALIGRRYSDVGPVARDVVVEDQGSGVVVLDSKNRIVDINPIGRKMLGGEGERIVGKQVQDVVDEDAFLTDDLDFLDPDVRDGTFEGLWARTETGERRCYDVVVTDLSAKDRGVSGRIGLIHDVTEQQERKHELQKRTEELERQKDRLDEFASVVAHDLRNPLNTAFGYADLAEETDDPAYFDELRGSLERMEDIVDDVLTVAREGQAATETEPVELATLARQAWNTVDTDEATFENEVDGTIQADPDRLLRVFENLFRNAIDHGGRDVTARVGRLEDGFFVEDDGPGIPETNREDVLRQGYTTIEDGTGFGLSIVATIVEAQGWTIDVTESADGGARFECTDCEIPPRSADRDAPNVPGSQLE